VLTYDHVAFHAISDRWRIRAGTADTHALSAFEGRSEATLKPFPIRSPDHLTKGGELLRPYLGAVYGRYLLVHEVGCEIVYSERTAKDSRGPR